MRTRTKRVVLGGALATIALLGYLALRPQPVPVDTVAVERGEMRLLLEEEGETRVRERYVISAPVAGRILRVDLDPGDPVVSGETSLVIFEPMRSSFLDERSRAEAQARVRLAEAALGRAKAQRQQARAELDYAISEGERFRRLVDQGILPQDRLEAAELETTTRREAFEAADFTVRTATHELEVARATLGVQASDGIAESLTLRSPVDGEVLRVHHESETVVAAGEPLLEVGDPASLEIVADYLSSDAVRIARGDEVSIEEWGGPEPLRGVVRRVEPAGFTKISALGVEEQRVNVIIDLRDRPPTLGDGYRVAVSVEVWRAEDALKVPAGSLFRDTGEWAVFLLRGRRAELRTVEIGEIGGFEAQVLSGLEAGDRVVVHPGDQVRDGVRVRQRD